MHDVLWTSVYGPIFGLIDLIVPGLEDWAYNAIRGLLVGMPTAPGLGASISLGPVVRFIDAYVPLREVIGLSLVIAMISGVVRMALFLERILRTVLGVT